MVLLRSVPPPKPELTAWTLTDSSGRTSDGLVTVMTATGVAGSLGSLGVGVDEALEDPEGSLPVSEEPVPDDPVPVDPVPVDPVPVPEELVPVPVVPLPDPVEPVPEVDDPLPEPVGLLLELDELPVPPEPGKLEVPPGLLVPLPVVGLVPREDLLTVTFSWTVTSGFT